MELHSYYKHSQNSPKNVLLPNFSFVSLYIFSQTTKRCVMLVSKIQKPYIEAALTGTTPCSQLSGGFPSEHLLTSLFNEIIVHEEA